MKNLEVADLLDRLGVLVEANGEDRFKVIAYRRAANVIRNMEEDIEEVWKRGNLQEIKYVGEGIAKKIDEYLKTGELRLLEELETKVPPGVPGLMKVQGVGPRTAFTLSHDYGITSVEELKKALETGKLDNEFGPSVKAAIMSGIAKLQSYEKKMLLPEAEGVYQQLALYFEAQKTSVSLAGSLRRGKTVIGDLDILSTNKAAGEVLARYPELEQVVESGPKRVSVKLKMGTQVDVRIFEEDEYGAAMMYFTGSKDHNVAMRNLAIEKGWKLNEYGLFETKSNTRLAGETEEEVFTKLGLQYIPPELRENKGEIEAARRGSLPTLVRRDEIIGDVQMHSTWSDGTEEIESMGKAAKEMGYEYIAMTDHSVSVRIAGGLSEERFRRQWKEIDKVNEKLAPFIILKGVEVEIRNDGTLDFERKFLDEFEVVGASLHQGFKQPPEKLTERAVNALSHPSVDFLCHPTNRMIGSREGHQLDLPKVIKTAKENGKMLEIDGQPKRLDLDENWAKRAMEEGVPLVIDSDAHSSGELDNMGYGVLVGRRGWLEAKNVVNTRGIKQLERLLS